MTVFRIQNRVLHSAEWHLSGSESLAIRHFAHGMYNVFSSWKRSEQPKPSSVLAKLP